jgi:glyceraldehyde-3-phosphate dehydrogenase/erythrose-4-phosphate dehydrogenase
LENLSRFKLHGGHGIEIIESNTAENAIKQYMKLDCNEYVTYCHWIDNEKDYLQKKLDALKK